MITISEIETMLKLIPKQIMETDIFIYKHVFASLANYLGIDTAINLYIKYFLDVKTPYIYKNFRYIETMNLGFLINIAKKYGYKPTVSNDDKHLTTAIKTSMGGLKMDNFKLTENDLQLLYDKLNKKTNDENLALEQLKIIEKAFKILDDLTKE